MRIFFTIGILLPLLACESSTGTSKRSSADSAQYHHQNSDRDLPPRPGADEVELPWIGIVPDKAILTTQRTIHNITLIDSDLSMSTELPFGLLSLAQEAAKVKKTQTQTGFEVVSADHAFVVVDNSSQLFANGERTTIINKVLTNSTLKAEIMLLLNEQLQKDPDYPKKTVPSITVMTDGDIPVQDQEELSAFLQEHFPDGQFYLHLIASPDTVPVSDWCLPEAKPEQWDRLRAQFPKSLRLSICDPDWYGNFRKIGKRVIYDQAVVRITLPSEAIVEGGKPFLRFNQQTFPADLFQYDATKRQIELRMVDMPSNIQTIDIGFQR
jgi:hypothetical protein